MVFMRRYLLAAVVPAGWLFADDTLTHGSGCTRLPGFPSAEATAAQWRARTGRATDALEWYLVFAGVRFTVIMLRIGTLLADIGLVPPSFAYDNLVSQGLGHLLARVWAQHERRTVAHRSRA